MISLITDTLRMPIEPTLLEYNPPESDALNTDSAFSTLSLDLAGTRGRPALAHRNLCLENVFLKPDGTACIGGLEYALCPAPTPLPMTLPELLAKFDNHVREWSTQTSASTSPFPSLSTQSTFISSNPNESSSVGQSTAASSLAVVANIPTFPEWWPVCGLHVTSPSYMAPEVSENLVETFEIYIYRRTCARKPRLSVK